MIDATKARRESMRWYLLLTLHNARPLGAYTELVLATIQGIYPDASQKEVLNELEYLHVRELIKHERKPDGRYHSELTRWGVDIVEYTVSCEPGIQRPEKYWN